jgi:hypothetical protein
MALIFVFVELEYCLLVVRAADQENGVLLFHKCVRSCALTLIPAAKID